MSDIEDAVDQILDQWGRERPDLDCSPMGIIGRITQLQREVYLAQRATFARHGLDAPSFDVLAALRRAGRALPADADRAHADGAGDLRRDHPAAGPAGGEGAHHPGAQRGRRPGRRRHADHRRARRALDAALPDHLETERRLLEGLPADDREQLAALLRRLLVALGHLPQEP